MTRSIRPRRARSTAAARPSSSVTSTPASTSRTRTSPRTSTSPTARTASAACRHGTVAANDDNGHGTHTAGTIAAATNGIGIVGVAPNVKIAGIKAGDAAGFFFPEAVICAFVWAGTHDINVTNNSYFADPWLFNCRNDAEQRAIWKAERRAIEFAQQEQRARRVADGQPGRRPGAPDADAHQPGRHEPGAAEQIHNDCAVVPVEVPGVVGVTANGNTATEVLLLELRRRTADVIAPGGDSILQVTAARRTAGALDVPAPAYRHLSRRRSSTRPAPRTATCRAPRWPRRTSPAWRR